MILDSGFPLPQDKISKKNIFVVLYPDVKFSFLSLPKKCIIRMCYQKTYSWEDWENITQLMPPKNTLLFFSRKRKPKGKCSAIWFWLQLSGYWLSHNLRVIFLAKKNQTLLQIASYHSKRLIFQSTCAFYF